MRLRDKIILVTGSTTGIGEAIARQCLAEGAKVAFHGRDAQRGQSLVAEFPGRSTLELGDLADPLVPRRLVDATVAAFGRIDGLVNNAALVSRNNLASTDAACFDRLLAVNTRAPLLLIQAAYPYLKQSRGAVLNIGSINAYCGEANLLAYSISKGGLMTLSRNLADALADVQIRVNHFNVGWVLTPNEYRQKIADGLPAGWPQQLSPQFVPSGSLLRPEDIAAAAVYWLSDESRPISGSVVALEQYPVIGRNPTKQSK